MNKSELFWINMARLGRLLDEDERERRVNNLIDHFGCQPGLDRLAVDCIRGQNILAPRGDVER